MIEAAAMRLRFSLPLNLSWSPERRDKPFWNFIPNYPHLASRVRHSSVNRRRKVGFA